MSIRTESVVQGAEFKIKVPIKASYDSSNALISPKIVLQVIVPTLLDRIKPKMFCPMLKLASSEAISLSQSKILLAHSI